MADQRQQEDRHGIFQRRPALVDSTVKSRFPRLFLGIGELDAAFRGPLGFGCGREVAAAVGHPVAVHQELLPVAEVGLQRTGLLLEVECARLLPRGSGSMESSSG